MGVDPLKAGCSAFQCKTLV